METTNVGEIEATRGKPDATTAGELEVDSVVIETALGSDELGSTLVGCRDLELITAGCDENGLSDVVVAVGDRLEAGSGESSDPEPDPEPEPTET